MKLRIREVVAATGAPVPPPVNVAASAGAPVTSAGPVVAPQPVVEKSAIEQLRDTIRTTRESTGALRDVVREGRALVDDLQPVLDLLRGLGSQQQGTQQAAPAAGPASSSVADAAAVPPPDDAGASRARVAEPPDTEQQAALREEVKALARKLTRKTVVETVLFKGPLLLEAKKFSACADLLSDNGEALGTFLHSLPEEQLQAAVSEVIAKRPAGDLRTVKGALQAMLKAQEEANGSAGPADQSAAPKKDGQEKAGGQA